MKFSIQTAVLPELDWRQVLEKLRRHGYDAVEWRVHPDYHLAPRELVARAAEVAAAVAEHGLAVSCLMGYAPLDDLEQQRWFAEACSVMNCPRYRPGAVIFDGKRDYPSLYQESVDALGRTLDAIAGSGAKPVIETHFNTIAPSASLAFNLVRQFEPARVGVNFDPANMIIEGREAWLMALQILGPYLDYVHAKNIVWRERDGVWRWEFAPMDAGQVDWVEVVGALRRVGYDGYIAFENFFEVPMTSRGYVGEDLTQHATKFRDIDSRLAADLAYFKNLLVSVNAPASA